LQRAEAAGVPARPIGYTGGDRLRIAVGSDVVVDVPVGEAERIWADAIARYFTRRAA
jgi:hypothetical protein